MTRVALYARYSSGNKTNCASAGRRPSARTVVSTYKDAGISGASMFLRPGIQTFLQDAQRGQFDVVLAVCVPKTLSGLPK